AGDGVRVGGCAGAGRRLRNKPVLLILGIQALGGPDLLWRRAHRLILLNRMLLRSHVLLRSGARRLILLNSMLLRSQVLLWSRVASGARGRCDGTGRTTLARHILRLARLGNPGTRAAADRAAAPFPLPPRTR